MANYKGSQHQESEVLKGITIMLTEAPSTSKAEAEKFVMAIYGKALIDFARDLELASTQE